MSCGKCNAPISGVSAVSREKPRNLAASVRQKLFNRAQERHEDFGLVLTKYGLERFLYRLAQSKYRDQFVLKGALLFELWTHRPYRPTRDLDLEGQGENSIARIKRLFAEIISQAVEDDGLVFDLESLHVARIKEDQEYEGLRVNFVARLERAKIHMQVDVGFGDVIIPPPQETAYPAMLDFPSAHLLAYTRETVIAEKLEALVKLGIANLVKFIILLHKVAYDYVTLFDVYECAISPPLLQERIKEAEHLVLGRDYLAIPPDVYANHATDLMALGFVHDLKENQHLAPATPELRALLKQKGITPEARTLLDRRQAHPEKLAQFDAVRRWFQNDWQRIEPKLRTSIVEGVSVFLSLFDDNPKVKKVFCPPKDCYDPAKNAHDEFGKPLPSFSWLIEHGRVCALNFPIGMNAGLAKALGVMMKLDFERAVLNRVPEMEARPNEYFRQVLFLCDEYQHFATVGESEPTGDEKFFSLSRQPKCIPIVATQSISSLKSALSGDAWRTLLQTFRTKIFLALSDDFSAHTASVLCGREDQLKVSYSLSESGHDTKVSWLTGKALSHKANLVASKSYNTQTDYRFDMKTFTELRNAQSVTLAYDGVNAAPPAFCYLKPYYNDPNRSYFQQLAEGAL